MNADMIHKILWAIVQMFGMFGIGAVVRHLKYIEEDDLKKWSHFTVDCLLPFLVFHSMVTGLQVNRLHELWLLPVIGFGMIALGAVVGYAVQRGLANPDDDVRRTFLHLCAVNNYGFLPIIIVMNLWGDTALANLFILNFGSTLGYWTIGVGILGGGNWRQALRNTLTPSLVALLLGFLLAVTGLGPHLPQVVLKITGMTAQAFVPVVFILIGASLYGARGFTYPRDLAFLSILRLAAIPALTIIVVRLLPIADDIYRLSIIIALMPCSASSTILTRRYGGCPRFAGQAAVITTLLSLVTIPIGLWLIT